ncbi:15681_t:CDS:2 [Funneliformis geosporum]|uniref:12896_t:CDS:1 n=1 Tax=Funneliformis geosporum TaxID=1117311 RepID=A0A9W4SVE1_9GLOM|nr:15681_t:CDS:2 [Funneliformis geosporum]CAI2181977.1 12896_t:CDS:2 [Funneliformis geosporum]
MFNKKHFIIENIPDLTGKVAIVTGGNTGIGYITARELSRKNAHVFIASRNKERGEGAVEKIKKETGNNQVEYLYLDLNNLKNVKKSAESFLSKDLPLHILINNAGIMATPWTLTEDGIQDQFGLFTMTLLAKIEASAPSRIVNVSSLAHNHAPAAGIEFDKINQEGAQSSWEHYGISKLANILFTESLSKRLEGKEVYVNSIHPGFVHTELSRGVVNVTIHTPQVKVYTGSSTTISWTLNGVQTVPITLGIMNNMQRPLIIDNNVILSLGKEDWVVTVPAGRYKFFITDGLAYNWSEEFNVESPPPNGKSPAGNPTPNGKSPESSRYQAETTNTPNKPDDDKGHSDMKGIIVGSTIGGIATIIAAVITVRCIRERNK